MGRPTSAKGNPGAVKQAMIQCERGGLCPPVIEPEACSVDVAGKDLPPVKWLIRLSGRILTRLMTLTTFVGRKKW